MAYLCPSPSPTERVIQVCVGVQHGIMLTDAGTVFTWGDNRYGQLGRPAHLVEEDQKAFPVVGMLEYEVTQVAAGTNHCLALAAPGVVWAWGRNKAGQLGCGDYRDKIAPVEVLGLGSQQLGADSEMSRIVCVSAGLNSSVAAALNSDIWQWGEVSSGYCERQPPVSARGGRAAKTEAPKPVPNNRPYRVFEKPSYRSGLRSGNVSICRTGCRVMGSKPAGGAAGGRQATQQRPLNEGRIKDLVDAVRQLQAVIAQERVKLQLSPAQKKELQALDDSNKELAAVEANTLSDTIVTLERDVLFLSQDLEKLEENLRSCDEFTARNRLQIQQLTQHAMQLHDKKDQIELNLIGVPSKSAERTQKEEKLEEIKEFLESNKNTRMALLDKRTESDTEKQRLGHALREKRLEADKIKKRLDTLRSMRSMASGATGVTDPVVKFLREQLDDFSRQFEKRVVETEFTASMQELEGHFKFLSGVEGKVQERAAATSALDKARAERADQLLQLLRDVVGLRRSWVDLLQDEWLTEELDLSCFFYEAGPEQFLEPPKLPARDDSGAFAGALANEAAGGNNAYPALQNLQDNREPHPQLSM